MIAKNSGGWEKGGTCQYCESYESFRTYNYHYCKATNNNLSISTGPSTYSFCMLFGPPLLPVIPNVFLLITHPRKKHPFFVDVLFDNFNGKRVDISSVKFIFPDKKLNLNVDSIRLIPPRKVKKGQFIRSGMEKGKQKIADSLYQFEQDIVRLRFYFNSPRNKITKMSIDFSMLQVNDSIVPFPTINYVKRGRFTYDPFVTGH